MPATVAGWAVDALTKPWEPFTAPSAVLCAVTGLDRERTAGRVARDCSVIKGSRTAPISPITFLVLLDVLAWDRGKDKLIKFLHERCTIERSE